ncbi:MAG: hypothetical protein AB1489_06970 [Acidobacteriota bacterium]
MRYLRSLLPLLLAVGVIVIGNSVAYAAIQEKNAAGDNTTQQDPDKTKTKPPATISIVIFGDENIANFTNIELPKVCVYSFGDITVVPTFPPIFVVDANGEIVVDETLHCTKQKQSGYNGPILTPYKKTEKQGNN